MARFTRSEIVKLLLTGSAVPWSDANGKTLKLGLVDEKQRRLFAFLLNSKVRKPTDLPPQFIAGLASTYNGSDDPASNQSLLSSSSYSGPWKLHSVEAEGFGGLNTWRGGIFRLDFEQQSLLLEGPNGSGKSSLAGAILWALTGERPRDQARGAPHEPRPVFSAENKPAGDWPPIACYPDSISALKADPIVRVKLTLEDPNGTLAIVERKLADGGIITTIDPALNIPIILIEAGILMPARLAQLRLDDGGGRLTEAVQKLTGLDDLVEMGTLVEGLCHKSREYQNYKTKEYAIAKKSFDHSLETARTALTPVAVDVADFVPSDTQDPNGQMAQFGKLVKERAIELAQVISTDLSSDLSLSSITSQNQIIAAIGAARDDLRSGLHGLPSWKKFEQIAAEFNEEDTANIDKAIASARTDGREAASLFERSINDSKFRLKAVAARWHADHASGPILNCPLCEASLQSRLAEELDNLRSAGDAAARTFDDNIVTIISELDGAIPTASKTIDSHFLRLPPREKLLEELRAQFVSKERYAKCLVRMAALVEHAITSAPTESPPDLRETAETGDSILRAINEKIDLIEQIKAAALWFQQNANDWTAWWENLASLETDSRPSTPPTNFDHEERLFEHLDRLSDALSKAEPYRKAAEAMRGAWVAGKEAYGYQQEIAARDEIGKSLSPLKALGSLCEAVSRDAIDGLSGKVSNLLDQMLLAEQFRFQGTQLQKKEGLIVHGGFSPDVRIDATLIANTSWLRAVLWCFVFALREEALDQLGLDSFPVLVFDDPQTTFDTFHRARWARYVASLQHGPSKAQVVLVTYEETFIDLIKNDGITGRQALISAPGPGWDRAAILEGASLERRWAKALNEKTPEAAVDYLDRARVFVEGMLKLLLRGEAPKISKMLLGQLRELLHQLHAADKAPWSALVFASLLGQLERGRPEIKYLEGSHHTTGQSFGMIEANDVAIFMRKTLLPSLDRAYRTAREHRLLHGGMKALHSLPPTAVLPEGYKAKVRAIPLPILGRAAASTNGRAADGTIDMNEIDPNRSSPMVLKNHSAFRLTTRTLEPVARVGDILITKEAGEPSSRSLVVALNDARVLARRFEISENQNDIAVLVAQAINPRQIAPPVIALKTTLTLHKIVGILFEHNPPPLQASTLDEVCDCGGESAISAITSGTLGLVEVSGDSAEPLALDGQYLIVKNAITPFDACKAYDGRPVIAENSNGQCYFKRLQVLSSAQVVLESLESGGDFRPIVLSMPGAETETLNRVWPVVGILFERP